MNRETAKQLMDELNKVLPEIGKKLNVSLSLGRTTFNSNTAKIKIEAASITTDGEVLSKEIVAFKQYAHHYGLKPEDLGKTFTSYQGTYTICGLAERSHKFPILAKNSKGKVFKFPAVTVSGYLHQTSNAIPPLSVIQGNAAPLSAEFQQKFLDLCSRLSPENLACDGEISKRETQRRYRQCMAEWHELERQVGRSVTEDEIWAANSSRL